MVGSKPSTRQRSRAAQGLVVIDEIQRQPAPFSLPSVLADRDPLPARFLILGSASSDLVRGVSESLAGRVTFVAAPKITRSMRVAMADLRLERWFVVHPGADSFAMDQGTCLGALRFSDVIDFTIR